MNIQRGVFWFLSVLSVISKLDFEITDKTDEVSSKHRFEVVDKTDEVSYIYIR